jgi:flagellar motor switch protein FliN
MTENEKIIASWSDFAELPVPLSIELGRTRLKIREILDLEYASVIKLSRSSGEGVDIRTGDKALLRGEIVVIEDRAGVRVSEILLEENQ